MLVRLIMDVVLLCCAVLLTSLLTRLRALAADDDDADTDRCIISIDRWYDGEMVEVKFFPTRSLGRKYEHGRSIR